MGTWGDENFANDGARDYLSMLSAKLVATVTEIYHFLRLLYSKVGEQHCPKCKVAVQQQTPGAIAESVRVALKKGAVRLCAPMIRGKKGFHTKIADMAQRQGFMELVVDGKVVPVASFRKLERFFIFPP